jgi:phenylacetic acid degradation operon negative regulatory protein
VALSPKPVRSARRASLRALERVGLREGLPGLWVRPDNLRATLAETSQRLRALELEDSAALFRASDFDDATTQRWAKHLWPLHTLQRSYQRTRANLERSLLQLERMPRHTSLVQSFVLGGAAIRLLAGDPLLPEEILPGDGRARLTDTMLRYDQVGRSLWRRFATEPELSLVKTGVRAG